MHRKANAVRSLLGTLDAFRPERMAVMDQLAACSADVAGSESLSR